MSTPTVTPPPLFSAVRRLHADLDTPVSAYLKVSDSSQAISFLLENVEGGERQARYSFIGTGEIGRYELRGSQATLSGVLAHNAEQETLEVSDPLAVLYQRVLRSTRLPDHNPDELGLPDMLFIVPEGVVIFDHLRHHLYALAWASCEAQAQATLERLVSCAGHCRTCQDSKKAPRYTLRAT